MVHLMEIIFLMKMENNYIKMDFIALGFSVRI